MRLGGLGFGVLWFTVWGFNGLGLSGLGTACLKARAFFGKCLWRIDYQKRIQSVECRASEHLVAITHTRFLAGGA